MDPSRPILVRSVRRLIAAYEAYRSEAAVPLSVWSSTEELVVAADHRNAVAAKTLAAAMRRSNRLLAPLVDPLLVDLDDHRWLASDREESYSDWLAWIVRQLRTPRAIFGFFGLDTPASVSALSADLLVDRERVTQEGRLDLVIEFGAQAVLAVEVKLNHCDEHVGAQLRRYEAWLRGQEYKHRFAVVVGSSAAKPHFGDFQFLSWKSISRRLRRLGRTWRNRRNLIPAALALAFAGAIEQNLLGFSGRAAHYRATASADYVAAWMDRR